MPLYEYECLKNGHRFELIRKFSDPPLTTCIHCKSKVRKLHSAPAIAFKGTGWYVTDYARKSGGESGGGKKPGSEGNEEKKADSSASEIVEKPAEKASDKASEKTSKKEKKKSG